MHRPDIFTIKELCIDLTGLLYLDRAVVRSGITVVKKTVQRLSDVVEGVADSVFVEGGLEGLTEFVGIVGGALYRGVVAEGEGWTAHEACVVTPDVRRMSR